MKKVTTLYYEHCTTNLAHISKVLGFKMKYQIF